MGHKNTLRKAFQAWASYCLLLLDFCLFYLVDGQWGGSEVRKTWIKSRNAILALILPGCVCGPSQFMGKGLWGKLGAWGYMLPIGGVIFASAVNTPQGTIGISA